MKRGSIVRGVTTLCVFCVMSTAVRAAPAAPLPTPVNVSCQGWEESAVRFYWKDEAPDETAWKVERNIGGAGWVEVASLAANTRQWFDTGADPTVNNRQYRVRSYRSGDASYSPYSAVCNNRRALADDNFRVFYGLRGVDDCPMIDGRDACTASQSFVQQQINALQGARASFLRAGFDRDPGIPPSGLDRIPINIVWCDAGGCAGGGGLSLSPLLIETPFSTTTRIGDPVAWMVPEHELFHFQQSQYGGLSEPDGRWVVEGQARMSQDKFCIGAVRASAECFDDIDTGYAGYVPEVDGYLSAAHAGLRLSSYRAALYWTYMTEKFGTNAPADPVEAGTDFVVKFWQASAALPGRSGIQNIDSVLSAGGYTHTFRTSFKDFIIANYAKDLTGTIDSKYRYADMAQPGGTYDRVMLSGSRAVTTSGGFLAIGESVAPWGARYYEFRPSADVTVLPITVTQDALGIAFYTVLGIRNGEIVREIRRESRHLELALINENFDAVMVMVAGLDGIVNYRISVNGAQPTLRIVRPTASNKVQVGDPTLPDKFLATVDVVDAAGLPLPGLTPDQFHFAIGGRAVPTENIVGSAIVQGQAWFVMRALTQTTTGDYDLTVDFQHALTATEVGAVQYQPRIASDNVLVLDRSGSMSYSDKLSSTKDAAKLYIDSWKPGDRIAVESFDNVVEMPMQLKDWTTDPPPAPVGSREEAQSAIDALTPRGLTAIGDAIMAGWEELKARGVPTHTWALVLLSDGLHNAGVKSFDDAALAIANSSEKKPNIHTLAVGPDADRLKMDWVARINGGTYHYVSAPADGTAARGAATITDTILLPLHLDEKYRYIATQVDDMQQFFSLNGPIMRNSQVEEIFIPVDAKADEMVLSLSWLPALRAAQLTDPSGTLIAPTLSVADRQMIWRVRYPTSGMWRLLVYGVNQTEAFGTTLPPYYVQGALRSTLALHAFATTPVDQRTPGAPVHLVAFLNDSRPVLGATVTATVVRPDPDADAVVVSFHDDGAHGDGEADDGVYGADFLRTELGGSYQVKVFADGSSEEIGAFHREALLSFHIVSEGDDRDSDQDGLPDPWEKHYRCLRVGRNDADADPDKDGLSNAREYALGTNPCDPDSDNDGESDGTDPRPLDHDEGRTQPPWTVAWPGRSKTWVKYVATGLSRALVYRRILSYTTEARLRPAAFDSAADAATDDADPYVLVASQQPPTGIVSDTADVIDGFSYCYLLVGETADGQRTVAHDETCTTPRYDPAPPHGGLLIDGGAALSRGRVVSLTLIASDSVSPHTHEDHGGEEIEMPHDAESGVAQMRISDSPAFTGAAWEPYQPGRAWVLSGAHSPMTLYAQYRDGAGNESEVYAAAIHLAKTVYVPLAVR